MPKDGEPIAPTKQKSDYNHLSVSRDWWLKFVGKTYWIHGWNPRLVHWYGVTA